MAWFRRRPSDESEDDGVLPELTTERWSWLHYTQTVADTSFWAVARRLPSIVREALALAWRASPRDTVATVALNLAAGVMTTLGLLAASSVLNELFAAGPTPDRVRAALPALIWAAVAVTARGALSIAAGWAQARLSPQISYQVELGVFGATTEVRLEAFDDAGFAEELDRARDRGTAGRGRDRGLDHQPAHRRRRTWWPPPRRSCVIAPVLLPCLLLAGIPAAATAVRVARRSTWPCWPGSPGTGGCGCSAR